jgi:hypothetical protein
MDLGNVKIANALPRDKKTSMQISEQKQNENLTLHKHHYHSHP